MAQAIVDARDAALTALLDDATTVPPGRLDLSAALVAQLAHRRGPHAWTLGRFVVSPDGARSLAGQLAAAWAQVDAAVGEQGQAVAEPPPLPLAVVLARVGVASLSPTLDAELVGLAALAGDPGIDLQAVEVTLLGPGPAAEIEAMVSAVGEAGLTDRVEVGCEIPLAGRPAGEVVRRLEAVAAARGSGASVRAMLRLSGTMPAATPSMTEVAGFLRTCAALAVPVRATGARRVVASDDASAGSSPAQRTSAAARPRPAIGRDVPGEGEHGILTLLGAAVVAHQGGALADIRDMLVQSGDRLRLGSGALIVGDEVLESELLGGARDALLHGIGCADLDGPVRQLAAIGALARTET
ncbi:MAG TPA: hypothetical protein VMM13_21290 [Euzebya sp.]|nr:hypothetical protein [Euzebya sp.]